MGKMMIVDDSSTMRRIIVRTLRQAGIAASTVLEATNGLEALELLMQRPDVSLVLSDVNMPDMDGITMVRRAREMRGAEDLPIIMISAEGSEAMQNEALKEGANGYVTKPFTVESMLASLAPFLPEVGQPPEDAE